MVRMCGRKRGRLELVPGCSMEGKYEDGEFASSDSIGLVAMEAIIVKPLWLVRTVEP